MAERLVMTSDAQRHVDAYLEYRRIVGDDDGGRMFSEAEFEAYKARVLPQRRANRLFVSWRLRAGREDESRAASAAAAAAGAAVPDCREVGPETRCFCGHHFRQHQTDQEGPLARGADAKLPCRQRGCRCSRFVFVPVVGGGRPVRCRCKHLPDEHSERRPFKCAKCSGCPGFSSAFTCDCGLPADAHETRVETRAERMERGAPVDDPERGGSDYQAMGGLVSFSSLASGPARADAHAKVQNELAAGMDRLALGGAGVPPSGGGGGAARRKMTEAEEMALYEKRYQQRLRNEREARRKGDSGAPSRNYAVALNMPPMWLMDGLDDASAAPEPPASRKRPGQAAPTTRSGSGTAARRATPPASGGSTKAAAGRRTAARDGGAAAARRSGHAAEGSAAAAPANASKKPPAAAAAAAGRRLPAAPAGASAPRRKTAQCSSSSTGPSGSSSSR